jgi:beta-lactam-binding protein with PASTA domain
METKKENQKKQFDTVKTFRKIKDKISEDLKGMSFDEIKEYLKRNSAKLRAE